MKPDWDKLIDEYKDNPLVGIADVDCTAEGKSLCSAVGVRGYPTIKYWLVDDDLAKDYKGGRSYADLKKFTEDTFKAGCDVETEANCNDDQKKIIKDLKGKDAGTVEKKLKEVVSSLEGKEKDLKKHNEDSAKKTKDLEEEIKKLRSATVMHKKFAKKVGVKGHDEL